MADQDREFGRIAALDLLRGLAAIAVAVPHFFMYYQGATGSAAEAVSIAAVEVFFVLSGFVLGPQIVLCARRSNWATLRTFLVRRWMRTIPSYIVALLAISVIFKEVGSSDFFRYMLYVQNLFRQHNARDYFPVAWSLSVEEWYYLIFPVFLLAYEYLSGRTGKTRQLVVATLVFIVVITLGRIVLGPVDDWGATVRRVVVFRIDSIAYGFLLYLLVSRARLTWDLARRCVAAAALIATTAIMLYVNAALLAGNDSAQLRYLHPFASAAFGISAIVFFLSIDALATSRRARAVFAYVGHISYPVYLFHLAVLYGLARATSEPPGPIHFALYVVCVIFIATIFHYAFERPVLAARPRYRDNTRSQAGVLESVSIVSD